jgi:hypothetical protein
MLGKEGVPEFVARLREYVQELASMWLQAAQIETDQGKPRELLASFLGSAYLGVIRWWLENDQPINSEELSDQLLQLTVLGVPQVLGLDPAEL